jgi:ketosteroid isomerase-like protein
MLLESVDVPPPPKSTDVPPLPRWSGDMTFFRSLAILAKTLMMAACAWLHPTSILAQEGEELVGVWEGTLEAGMDRFRIVFNISRGEDGALTATLDSPDQVAEGIPVTALSLDGDSVALEVASVGGRYAGSLSADGTSILGTWSQGPASFPLTLEKVEDAAFWTHGAAELVGREVVTAAFGPVLDQYDLEQEFRIIELLVSGDLAFMRGVEHNRITPKSRDPPIERVQRGFSILPRDLDGEWKFARGMTNLPPAE